MTASRISTCPSARLAKSTDRHITAMSYRIPDQVEYRPDPVSSHLWIPAPRFREDKLRGNDAIALFCCLSDMTRGDEGINMTRSMDMLETTIRWTVVLLLAVMVA